MSASTEKKNRKLAKEAGTDKKTKAAEELKKEQAKSRRNWTIGITLVVLLIALTLFLNSGFLFKNTAALRVNGEKVSPAEVTYYYGEQALTYRQYSQMYGLDMSSWYSEEEMIDSAVVSLKQVKAYVKYANDNGIALTEEEIAEVDNDLASLKLQVITGGYRNLDTFYEYNYGTGVSEKLARKIMLEQKLADKARQAKEDSLTYTGAELAEYFEGLDGEGDSFSYDYYYVAAELVDGAPDESGNPVSEATPETLAAARADADAIVAAYGAAEGESASERFAAAVSTVKGADPSSSKGARGSSLNSAFKDWLMEAGRMEGDITVAESSANNGYYVVMFKTRSDNKYSTVSMRHILVKAVADENGEYTDEAVAAAHSAIEDIYAQWQAGEKTEESFAMLAIEKTEDTGSMDNGGMYNEIYKGQMVPEIEEWLFAGRKAGDVEVIDVESAGYTGTHLVYFVGEDELYSNVIAKNDLVNTAMSEWETSVLETVEVVNGGTYNLIGK